MDCLVGRAKKQTTEEHFTCKPSGMQKDTLKFSDTPAQAEKLHMKCELNATWKEEGINYY